MTSRVPILVTILGATGTGKSKLAIELAQKYVGEIISADSMQVYKGLDVITAKVTKEEQAMAPHHMLDIIDPLSTFTVVDFRNRALPIIEKLLEDKKMPIIVGGTNYYIESLLWQVLVEDPKDRTRSTTAISAGESEIDNPCSLVFDRDCGYVKILDNYSKSDGNNCDDDNDDDADGDKISDNKNNKSIIIKNREKKVEICCSSEEKKNITKENENDNENDNNDRQEPPFKKIKFDDPITNDQLHDKLKEIDPESAARLHPNNRRKIIRSLQVFEQLGTKHSEILRDQRLAGGSGLGGPLRYENSIILWLQCDQKVLDERLNSRVDTMLESGLVQELLDFHEIYNQERIKSNELPDYTKGIFQSIGFKEFHDYLILDKEEKETEKGKKLLEFGIENLKLRTRRYARRQHRWVMNRFIKRSDRQVPPVYSLNTTDISEWNEKVLEIAMTIINEKISGQIPSQKSLNNNNNNKKTENSVLNFETDNEQSYFCETCERVFIGKFQWKAHLDGRKHEKMVKRKKRINSL